MKLLVFLRASNLLLFVSLALEIKKKKPQCYFTSTPLIKPP